MTRPVVHTGRTIRGKYRLDRVLGQGGMGTVFEATHVILQQRCAVKLLHQTGSSEAAERFPQEARRHGQAARRAHRARDRRRRDRRGSFSKLAIGSFDIPFVQLDLVSAAVQHVALFGAAGFAESGLVAVGPGDAHVAFLAATLLGPTNVTTPGLAPDGTMDGLLARVQAGVVGDAAAVGGPGAQSFTAVAANAKDIVLGGGFGGSALVGTVTLQGTGTGDHAFVAVARARLP